MVHFVDEQGGPLSTIAKITERIVVMNENESKRYVTISAIFICCLIFVLYAWWYMWDMNNFLNSAEQNGLF